MLGQVLRLAPQDQLGEGTVEGPAAQRLGHPDLARHVQELAGQEQALVGPLPPQQGLGPDDLAAVEVHHGLVEERQLAVVHGVLEPVLDLVTRHDPVAHRRVEHARGPALVAGPVHGQLGVLEDVVGRLAGRLGSVSTMPTVGRSRCSTPCTMTGRAAPSRMRLAMRRASASECTSAHATTNLSLATRVTMSVLRRATDSRLATSRATCSAAPAPNCWFTSCQPSSSTNSTASGCRPAAPPARACVELVLEQGAVGRLGEHFVQARATATGAGAPGAGRSPSRQAAAARSGPARSSLR